MRWSDAHCGHDSFGQLYDTGDIAVEEAAALPSAEGYLCSDVAACSLQTAAAAGFALPIQHFALFSAVFNGET